MFEENDLPYAGLPEWIPNSRKALRVALAAEGLLPRFVDAFWRRGRDIGDDAVIVEEAVAAGADEAAVREVLATDAAELDLSADRS
jgi:predicted DsbA family dithiol-disulfide isomerase